MRLTSNQQRVLDTLRSAGGPLGAYALLKRLRDEGFTAPVQVYRALERLRRHGLVHRLETLNAYVSRSPPEGGHGVTAFTICDDCGHIDELVDGALSRSLGHLVRRRAFSPGSATIEIHGRCSRCSGLANDGSGESTIRESTINESTTRRRSHDDKRIQQP